MAGSWKTIASLCILLHVYLLIGMLAFHFLEITQEDNTRIDTRKFKEQMLSNFSCLDSENLERLIDIVTNAINNGVDPSNNATSPSNWEYSGAFFFAGTVITTIGYGHISPSTEGGKSFCILYALLGIPLCGFLLSEFGGKLYQWKNVVQQRVNTKLKKKWQQTTFGVVFTSTLGIVFCVFILSIIFAHVEGWLYRDAVYYCFITLTTVGFGDFVASQNTDKVYPPIYKVLVFYWILVGLSQVALIIQDISKAMSTTVEKVKERSDSVLPVTKKHRDSLMPDELKEKGTSGSIDNVTSSQNTGSAHKQVEVTDM